MFLCLTPAFIKPQTTGHKVGRC